MRLLALEIEECVDCPYNVEWCNEPSTDRKFTIDELGYQEILENYFPVWCPLTEKK